MTLVHPYIAFRINKIKICIQKFIHIFILLVKDVTIIVYVPYKSFFHHPCLLIESLLDRFAPMQNVCFINSIIYFQKCPHALHQLVFSFSMLLLYNQLLPLIPCNHISSFPYSWCMFTWCGKERNICYLNKLVYIIKLPKRNEIYYLG